ncbi:unnamed protein product [Vitrella brassicaformis CCMP3155]|uniref:Roadblock/LAMTOR2 domain-containing protein n=1 Tax=Vitrella brassicaformis (strain CCMP3155) TaxID=1169540 RepID=A0A0G4EIQ2_VITBC|nr:unnamed protein product [Vitrella brassicaformis CCMP3155]|mmetsp:Transcript_49580/g.124310  ORF Transcript_49580/g.124310 Transcript_49580/m.124310 type:complete len:130 (-) Transcript_49580:176-565(-)|eukprot:CEL95777.1 unnamed protein product [Vitrella brassicaformis CCMP3155]
MATGLLRAGNLSACLRQEKASCPAIENIVLYELSGGVVAAAEKADEEQTIIVGAVLVNVYTEYIAFSEQSNQPLNTVLLSTQHKTIAMTAIGNLILCVVGTKDAPPGLLQNKMELLRNNLTPIFRALGY